MTEPRLRLHALLELLPGVPHRSVLVPVIERVLANERPHVVFIKLDDGGRTVPAVGTAEAVVDAFAAYQHGPFGVVAKGPATRPRNTMVIGANNRAGPVQGGLSFTWELDPSLTDGFVELLADLSVLLSAPLAVVSHQGDVIDPAGWESRVYRHIEAVHAAPPTGDVRYGLYRGLAGVAHRMVLGEELVAMFGEDRLGSLPGSIAQRHRTGRWVLSTTEDLLAWTDDRWCPEEAAVIEALGPEHFFDPQTGRLPTVAPEVPEVAPYRCTVVDPETREPVELHA